MEVVGLQVDARHLFIGDLSLRRIFGPVQDATHFQARGGRGAGDQVDNGRVGEQGLASPILTDE